MLRRVAVDVRAPTPGRLDKSKHHESEAVMTVSRQPVGQPAPPLHRLSLVEGIGQPSARTVTGPAVASSPVRPQSPREHTVSYASVGGEARVDALRHQRPESSLLSRVPSLPARNPQPNSPARPFSSPVHVSTPAAPSFPFTLDHSLSARIGEDAKLLFPAPAFGLSSPGRPASPSVQPAPVMSPPVPAASEERKDGTLRMMRPGSSLFGRQVQAAAQGQGVRWPLQHSDAPSPPRTRSPAASSLHTPTRSQTPPRSQTRARTPTDASLSPSLSTSPSKDVLIASLRRELERLRAQNASVVAGVEGMVADQVAAKVCLCVPLCAFVVCCL